MTAQEFHTNFNIELDKTLDFEYPYMLSEQIDYWLNKAQDRFIKDRAFPKTPNKQGFEESQKRIDDLRSIVIINSPLTINDLSTNIKSAQLPTDYLYLIRHQCTTTTPCGTKIVSGKQITNDEINIFLKDPFWKPNSTEPLYYIAINNIIYEGIIGFTLANSIISYIRKYNKIKNGTAYIVPSTDIGCELPEHTHSEILDIAISMVLENIESQRYQTNLNELTKSE